MALEDIIPGMNGGSTTTQVFDGNVNIESGKITIQGGTISISELPKSKNALVLDIAKTLYTNTAFDQVEMSPANISALCIKRAEAFVNIAKKLNYI